jgi:4-amino-4-deoxy-L-arabinose transferase-like glycosyltransferase
MKRLIKDRPDYLFLSISSLLALLYFSWDINSWKFAYIGDEWQFYAFARIIVESNFHINPFSLHGVHGQNSVMGSMYQALFLWLFGFTNMAWRFSNILLIIPSSIFFFLFAKKEFGKKIAVISTLLLQSSAYLANYFKIGYVNPQSFMLFTLSLYLASLCGRKPKKRNFLLLGAILGISFYIYLGPLFPFVIWPLLLPAIKSSKKTLLKNALVTAVAYAIIVLPAFVGQDQLIGPASKTILSREYHNNSQLFLNIYHNFLLFYKNYDYFYNHFVAGPYLDLISRCFAIIGIVFCFMRWKHSSYKYLLLSYVSCCIIIGLTSPYSYTPTTRGIFFLPFGFVFAAIGLVFIQQKTGFKKLAYVALPVAIFLNVHQSQIGVFTQTGHSATTLVIKMLQEAKNSGSVKTHILLVYDGHEYSGDTLPLLREAYGLHSVRFAKIYASQLDCKTLSEAKEIGVFSEDYLALETLYSNPCLKKETTIRKLQPNIYF